MTASSLTFDHLVPAVTQAAIVILICGIAFGIKWLFSRKTLGRNSFSDFIGLHCKGFKFSKKFLFVLGVATLAGISTTLAQFFFMPDTMALLKNDSSPYFKILKTGFSFQSLVAGLTYCLISSGFSEEVLFRGLIAKRLIFLCGFKWGNALQATLFWLPHYLLIWGVTKEWFSALQAIAFVTTMLLGLISCYWNEKESGGSIAPAWLLHSSLNFATFLTLATLNLT